MGLRFLPLALLALLFPGIAHGGESGDMVRDALYSGSLESGRAGLLLRANQGDAEAQFGVGTLTMLQGFEKLAQELYRYGFSANAGPLNLIFGTSSDGPAPINPAPDKLTYEGARTMLADLVTSMDAAKALLITAGEAGDYVIDIDPLLIRIDLDRDGLATAEETPVAIIARFLGVAPDVLMPAETPKYDADGKLTKDKSASGGAAPRGTMIGFDRADAFWLAGYSQVIAAHADFALSHDFETTFDAAFHWPFPQAGLPLQGTEGTVMIDDVTDTGIADAVALIHTINWPVNDPARLKAIPARFSEVIALSRRNWDAIQAETDDHLELLPSPRQTSPIKGFHVTDDMITAWMAALDTADEVIAGQLLIPHWRFSKGLDLKAYFETSTRFDLVLLATGYGALPFLKDGPIADGTNFAPANSAFGDAFPFYALWFN